MRIGVYPGTFDPITNGHINIIERASKLLDKVYVVIPSNVNKQSLFSVDERVELIREACKDIPNIVVDKTDKLTVDYCLKVDAKVIIRGLRAVSDYEYELQLATMNKHLNNDIETVFIMADHQYSFLSSSGVKEIVKFKGDVSSLVPSVVNIALKKKLLDK